MSKEAILSRVVTVDPDAKHDNSPRLSVDGEDDAKGQENESKPAKAGSTQSVDKVSKELSSEEAPKEEAIPPYGQPAEVELEEKAVEKEKSPPPLCFVLCPTVYAILDSYKGIVLGILTAVFLSLATFVAQKLTSNPKNYSAVLACAWRFMGVFITSLPLVGYYMGFEKQKIWETICPIWKSGDKQKTGFFLFIRCLVGTLSFFTQFYAIKEIPLGDASAIIFSNVVVVVFFAWCCLKEECGIVPTIAACLTVLGVIIVVRPPFIFGGHGSTLDETKAMKGYLLAIASLFMNALSYVSLRFLRDIHFSVMAFTYGLFGLLCSIIVAAVLQAFRYEQNALVFPLSQTDTGLFVLLAFLSALGQMTLTLAMKYEAAAIVSTLRATDVFFSFIWQISLARQEPNEYSIGGASLIMFCIFILGFRKWLNDLKDDHHWKKKLWFILK